MELQESKLYSFFDRKNGFVVHFLEGQKLISDLALTHDLKGKGFHFFRDITLTAELLVTMLKPKEQLGFFIDCQEPFYQFKLETNHSGQLRTLLLPADFSEFPEKLSAQVRLTKILPSQKKPYTSILEAKNISLDQVIKQVIDHSYQMNGETILAEESDQSVLILKLPQVNVDKEEIDSGLSLSEYKAGLLPILEKLFAKGTQDNNEITKAFASYHNLKEIHSRSICFQCNCSKERFIIGLKGLSAKETESLFDTESISVNCDYCRKSYEITKDDLNITVH